MASAVGSDRGVANQLLSMFVSPAGAASNAVTGGKQHRDVSRTAAPQVALGYKVTPINLVNGQVLAEPQILDGTSALALHGLLMKLHAQNMQEQLLAQSPADGDVAGQQSEVVSAAAQRLANHTTSALPAAGPDAGHAAYAGGVAAETGNGDNADISLLQQQQLPNLDDLPDEVLKLLPKELKQQGPEVLLERLEEYLHLRKQLASHELQHLDQPEQQESHQGMTELCLYLAGTARAGATRRHQHKYQRRLQGSFSNDSNTSCTDPLEVSPEQHDLQQGHMGRSNVTADYAQRWGFKRGLPANGEAAGSGHAAVAHDMLLVNGLEGAHHEDQYYKRRHDTAQRIPGSSYANQQPLQRDGRMQTAADDAAAALKRKRPAAGAQYRGVRMRPWGTYVAEIREPQTGTRVWLGTFTNPEEAALTYDAAVRELRGPTGVTNLPEPSEPDRSKYRAKARELLSKAQTKPGAKQPARQQQQVSTLHELQSQLESSQQQRDEDMQDAAAAAAGEVSGQQRLLQQHYQQLEFWRRPDDPEPQHSSSPAAGVIPPGPDHHQAGDTGVISAGAQEELEQIAGSSLHVADLGAYDQQAQQMAEELRRLQDAMLGQPAVAADGAAGPGSADGLMIPTGLQATRALLQ